ncbi:hypothetical protein ACFPVS_13460 [Neisseria weixii]|uniref:hypothetical protein n=1 Tax=Neisseria weixii TaxID=1853276 RepID=UPI000BB992A4|nr:hypothetical protein [Neisseria weixii]ATD64842.1 hypothetical protein CGZ65_05120 [Neisseria weixii]
MNLILEVILSFFFSQYDFSQKKYVNAVAKGILLGIIMFLLSFLNTIFKSNLDLKFIELIVIFLESVLIGIAIMSLVYLIDRIFSKL